LRLLKTKRIKPERFRILRRFRYEYKGVKENIRLPPLALTLLQNLK